MKIAIFSDLHLPNKPDARNGAFERALRELRQTGATDLWLLGDIFDLLTGPFDFWKRLHAGIFEALADLARSGCRVLWLEGNHDFHLKALLAPLGVRLEDGELTQDVNGVRTLLAHGDLVNADDKPYLKWRAFTRHPLFRAALSLTPERLAQNALLPWAERASRTSRGRARDSEERVRAMYRAWADKKLAQGYGAVLLGHCHVEDLHVAPNGFYLNLGSWVDGSMRYALWEPGREAFPKIVSCPIMEG